MWYAIMSEDSPGTLVKREAARDDHLRRLDDLQRQGRLLLAGSHPAIDAASPGPAGYSGSLIVAEFSSLTVAQSWADMDPYWVAGVTTSVRIKPFLKALP